jgi:tight adherence protein B
MNLYGSICGAGVGLGIIICVLGLQQRPDTVVDIAPTPTPKRVRTFRPIKTQIIGLVAGLVIGGFGTRIPVVTVVAGLLGFRMPLMSESRRLRQKSFDRLSAIATWIELIRDSLSSNAGIDDAIRSSVELAPELIQPELVELSHRSQSASLAVALHEFADDISDPVVDYVVTALTLASERGGEIQDLLGLAALNTRSQLEMRRIIEEKRGKTYMASYMILASVLVMAVFMFGSQNTYMAWYQTVSGQTFFALIGALLFVGVSSVEKLAKSKVPERIVMSIEPHRGTA